MIYPEIIEFVVGTTPVKIVDGQTGNFLFAPFPSAVVVGTSALGTPGINGVIPNTSGNNPYHFSAPADIWAYHSGAPGSTGTVRVIHWY